MTRKLPGHVAADIIESGGYIYLDLAQIRQWLGPPDDLLAALRKGQIEAYRVNGKVMVRSDDLLEWMAMHNRLPPEPRQ